MAKTKKKKSSDPILAAGGIVTRGRSKPVFAVVRLRRQKSWVLPKGKLNKDETAIAAAKREVIEETGHDVAVQHYLGSLNYITSGRPKSVRFWHMEASRRPVAQLMKDVSAVRWLPLDQAIKKLTHDREREFLAEFGVKVREHLQAAKEESAREKAKGGDASSRRRAYDQSGVRHRIGHSGPKEIMQLLWRWLRR